MGLTLLKGLRESARLFEMNYTQKLKLVVVGITPTGYVFLCGQGPHNLGTSLKEDGQIVASLFKSTRDASAGVSELKRLAGLENIQILKSRILTLGEAESKYNKES